MGPGHPMPAPTDWSFSPHPTATSAEHSINSRNCKQEEAAGRPHRSWQVFICCQNCSVKLLPSQEGCDSILSLCPTSLRLSLPCAISGKAISGILGLSFHLWDLWVFSSFVSSSYLLLSLTFGILFVSKLLFFHLCYFFTCMSLRNGGKGWIGIKGEVSLILECPSF